ncbi:hypothetical protein [Maricaulis sp.]|uniref:hypothetical protein n=1 Tax=Maricaulis sp. TaxID=1486257 RepID=UPI003A9279FC
MEWACQIDWQAWATFANAVAIGVGILIARQAVSRIWIERSAIRKSEVAEEALSNLYEAQDVFEFLRNPFSRSAVEDLKEPIQLRAAKTVYSRLDAQRDFFDKARTTAPKVRALFGAAAHDHYETIFVLRNKIANAAQNYVDFAGDPPDDEIREIMKDIRRTLYAREKDDPISGDINDAIQAAEKIFLPILRPGTGGRANDSTQTEPR